MKTFLDETLEAIAAAGKTVAQIERIGTRKAEANISWDEFCELAQIHIYQENGGTLGIRMDLVITFLDLTWLERIPAPDPYADGPCYRWIHREMVRHFIYSKEKLESLGGK